MFCKHEWKVLSETTTESKIEHLKSLAIDAAYNGGSSDLGRKHIQVVTCNKCGKLKRFVEHI